MLKLTLFSLLYVKALAGHASYGILSIDSRQQDKVFNSTITGKFTSSSNNFENSYITNCCYIYFSDETTTEFVYMHDSFPLQVTPKYIFFWPSQSTNFKITTKSSSKLNPKNTNLYCGDISEILGTNSIEFDRAKDVQLGSFPQNENLLQHVGYFQLNKVVNKGCKVLIWMKQEYSPKSVEILNHEMNNVKVEFYKSGGSFALEFGNLDQVFNQTMGISRRIYFLMKYDKIESISYSYKMSAEVVCNQKKVINNLIYEIL